MIPPHSAAEIEQAILDIWEQARPKSLREFDQIPMRRSDLLASVKAVAPQLAGKRVAFMGDHDGVSVILGLLAAHSLMPAPQHMEILDFDQRLLDKARELALKHGFHDKLSVTLYNAFDAVPPELIGRFDAFYTNPPYGKSNEGASVRLFTTRGMELASRPGAMGYIVLPYDDERQWTRTAKDSTTQFISDQNWKVTDFVTGQHAYHLDDDPEMKSALLTVKAGGSTLAAPPWAGRAVGQYEIAHFYGRSVRPPYPRYILRNGQRACWPERAAS